MELSHNAVNNSQDMVSPSEKLILAKTTENLNYLYPYGHRITHQMRWFKGSRDSGGLDSAA